MLDQLITLDQELLLTLNGSDSLFMDSLMWTLTQTSTWVPLLAGIIYILFKNQRPDICVGIIITAILLVLFTDQFSSGLCKPYFHRLRPTHTPKLAMLVDVVNGYRGGLYGFFSSHAANTFGAAAFFTIIFRHSPTALLLFCWAMLSSYTRIYLGVHFPLDIICGALFGLFSGTLFGIVCMRLCRQKAPHCEYSSSIRTTSGYVKSSFSIIFLMASVSMTYALLRSVISAGCL